MTGTSLPIVTAAPVQTFVVTQTQDDVLDDRASSPEADDSPVVPRLNAGLREVYLQQSAVFDAATQSRCSRLVSAFLRRKMKVERMEGVDSSGAEIESPSTSMFMPLLGR